MALTTMTTRGDIVANETKKVRVHILKAVKGENGKTLSAGETYTVSEPFAADLIRRRRACDPENAPKKASAKGKSEK